ncbi:MAG TPA: serine/threonine-protein kinase [Polyangia bacterium]|jgi:serine/threonine protein kinase
MNLRGKATIGLALCAIAVATRAVVVDARDPRIWFGLATLFSLAAVLVWRRGGKAEVSPPVTAETATHRNATVYIGGGDGRTEEDRRSTAKMGTPRTPASEPRTFGRYRLLRRIDGGGMADIYTAVLHGAEGFRRLFVLKRLRPELVRSRNAVDQFIDEAKLGSSLSHPNIVPVFDFGKVADEYFMAQEYVVGRDISRLLRRHVERVGRPLDERLMLYVAHEVLDALAYAHALDDEKGQPLGLVHRDVSPGNIMLTDRGEVKLLDFGIVKALGRVSTSETGVVKGNVDFMSPEQARSEPVDARSDLFSLGLVIHRGLTDQRLYKRSDGDFEHLRQAGLGPTPKQLVSLDDLPLAGPIVRRALALDPALRYQSAAEFAAAVAPHTAGGKAEAAVLMRRLFDDELRAHTA